MTKADKHVLRRLYPELTDEELEEAYETFTLYAALLIRMVERPHNEREESNDEKGWG